MTFFDIIIGGLALGAFIAAILLPVVLMAILIAAIADKL